MILLDTHTYLWFVSENPLLPKWVVEKIQISERAFVSIATFWEMAIKNRKGLLDLPAPISRMMEDCAKMNLTILPINGAHLDKMKQLPFILKDPFDRIMICQAQAENLFLVTVDEFVVQYDVKTVQYSKA